MKTIELLKTAWQSLRANPKRSLLTMIGIIIGIAAVITIMALGNGVKQKMVENFKTTEGGEQTTTINFLSDDPQKVGFTQQDILAIEQNFPGQVKNAKLEQKDSEITATVEFGNSSAQATSLGLTNGPVKDLKLVAGKELTKAAIVTGRNEALVAKEVAKAQYGDLERALGTPIFINNTSYTIVGIYEKNMNVEGPALNDVIVPKALYLTTVDTATGSNSLKLTITKGQNASTVSKKVVKYLKKNGSAKDNGQYEYFDAGAILQSISNVFDMLTYFISSIAGISLFIAGIGVMNMMYISVSERTQEIGIRLAIGATPRNIMNQFLLEAIMLTVGGGLLGFLCGWGLASLISNFLPYGIKAAVTINSFLLAFGVSTAVGIIFGILPAKQAANKNLIDILR